MEAHMETDIDALRREQLELHKRLDAIDAAIAEQAPEPEPEEIERRPTVTISVPANGSQRPTDAEMRALANLAYSEYSFLVPCTDEAFEIAFIAIGHMNRLPEPNRKLYFYTHTANVNDIARNLGFSRNLLGNAVLNAIICHNDIPWIAYASAQPLEVGLADKYRSGRPCSNAWRGLLAGHPFVPPLPPRQAPGTHSRLPTFSVY
jgi:hypothetical protein